MPNEEHLEIFNSGLAEWKKWRRSNFLLRPDLSHADLSGRDLIAYTFNNVNLEAANLSGSKLIRANFRNAYAPDVDCSGADLRRAYLDGAYLNCANLSHSDLRGADLERATLVDANLEGADMSGAYVYGVSAWGVELQGAVQSSLVISPWEQRNDSKIEVDNLEIAQFLYLLLNNQRIRYALDSITARVALILGRFTPERKTILDAIRNELRHRNYIPVLFDFEKPSAKGFVETISTLAHLARFVIADITDARSVAQELMAIVPSQPTLPVQPILLASAPEFDLFEYFKNFGSVLPIFRYRDVAHVKESLDSCIIGPAEAKTRKETKQSQATSLSAGNYP